MNRCYKSMQIFILKDFVKLNPKEQLRNGVTAKKIPMELLIPFCRDVTKYEVSKYSGGSKFKNGDTIMARITPCLENGKRARVSILDNNEIAFGSTEFIVFRVRKGISDADFVYYLVCSDLIREPAIKSMVGSSGRQCVQTDVIENLKIMLPSLPIQKKIAAVLSALDDKIELNNKINQNLEQQAQALFDNYFYNIASGNSVIGQYLIPKRGKNLLSRDAIHGEVPVVAGGLLPSTYHNVANTSAPVITISASGANAGYVNLWHIPVWSSDSSFIDNTITKNVYFWFVLLKKRQKEIFDAQTGSAQPHIYPQHVANLSISELDSDLVTYYNKIITPLFKIIGHNSIENLRLAQLRNALLPKLLSGEIDVSMIK